MFCTTGALSAESSEIVTFGNIFRCTPRPWDRSSCSNYFVSPPNHFWGENTEFLIEDSSEKRYFWQHFCKTINSTRPLDCSSGSSFFLFLPNLLRTRPALFFVVAHPFYYFPTFISPFLPTRNSDPGSPRKQALLPPPLHRTHLHSYREKASAISSLDESHRNAL